MTWTWKTELPSWLFLAVMFVLLAVSWSSSPARIPVHWNLDGSVDRYGSRLEGLALLPILAAVLYLLFRFLPVIDPRRANYDAFRTAYDVIRHGTLAIMAILYALSIAILRGASVGLVPFRLRRVGDPAQQPLLRRGQRREELGERQAVARARGRDGGAASLVARGRFGGENQRLAEELQHHLARRHDVSHDPVHAIAARLGLNQRLRIGDPLRVDTNGVQVDLEEAGQRLGDHGRNSLG